jgi:crossover junction endodeoxyribonuclease RusA
VTIQFFCPGKPAQQGSKRYVGNGIMLETNPELKSWRAVVATACPITTPLTCGIAIEIEFRYNRPASHFGTRSKQRYLKGNAPIYKTSAPDCDKLIRAVGDSLKGIAYVDDALIVKITASKLYTMGTAGALVTITPLSEP